MTQPTGQPKDPALEEVWNWIMGQREVEERFASVFRSTFDQLYDGQHTGRYKVSQLFKTEKTHFGTLIEINIQREFSLGDGDHMDYKISGHEVDCKYSHKGIWMLPQESFEQLVLVTQANDEKSTWSVGIIRVTKENRRETVNRDLKTTLSPLGRSRISWLFENSPMQKNALLDLPERVVDEIMNPDISGQKRINNLFRLAPGYRLTRNIIATVAQQEDYMKRTRASGGSRGHLKDQGIIVLNGTYQAQKDLAAKFGVDDLQPNELVSFRVTPTDPHHGVIIDGSWWRLANEGEEVSAVAPNIPNASAKAPKPAIAPADPAADEQNPQ